MSKPSLSHPLYGADIKTLCHVLARSGGVKPSRLPLAILVGLATMGRFPFTALEYGYVKLRRPKTEPLEPPIFILGHWRSGTTHLYNILSKADRFGYVSPFSTALPWDIMVIGRLFAPLLRASLPKGRYIDNVAVDPSSPQEDEIALANMTPISYYHGIYFPKKFDHYFQRGVFFDGLTEREIKGWEKTLRYLYLKLTLDQGGRQLLIKNPTYTARAAHLREIYPDAKFIHIHRNPHKVFVSMQNFYKKLFPQFALQDFDHVDIDNVIVKTYRRMMRSVIDDMAHMPKGQGVSLSFDDLQRDTHGELSRIYQVLNLGDYAQDQPVFDDYLGSVKNYKKNKFSPPEHLTHYIDEHLGDFIDELGYGDGTQ